MSNSGIKGIKGLPSRPLRERLEEKILRTFTCWLWTGSADAHGYGQINVNRKPRKAHRIAYELYVGPIPDGKSLDHLCRNPGCVNPAHLEIVTHRENVLRGIGPTAKNACKTICSRGHALTEENTYRNPRNNQRGCRICRKIMKAEWERRHRVKRLRNLSTTPKPKG